MKDLQVAQIRHNALRLAAIRPKGRGTRHQDRRGETQARANQHGVPAAEGRQRHLAAQQVCRSPARQLVDAARSVRFEPVGSIAGPNAADEPKRGDNAFATNQYYELKREEAPYGKAIAFDLPSHYFLTGDSGPRYEKFIVQAIQWGIAHRLRTKVLLSTYPWPTNSDGQQETFLEFTGDFYNLTRQRPTRTAIPAKPPIALDVMLCW
jgi:hypothetical protein